jgi:hypothetical protein
MGKMPVDFYHKYLNFSGVAALVETQEPRSPGSKPRGLDPG